MIQVEFFAERAMLYELFSRLFTYPLDPGVLSVVAGLSTHESPGKDSHAIAENLAIMQEPVLGTEDLNLLVETLNREATRLFEGPGQPIAPPYGSFYLNGKRLMGPEAIAVRKAYLAAQMLTDAENHQHPDHLALELGFLAALAEAPTDEAVDHFRGFIADHILSWLPMWKEDVMAAKPHPFFAGLVNFTKTTLEEDLAWINEEYPMLALDKPVALEELI